MKTSVQALELCKATIWDYYSHHRRDMPWRNPGNGGLYDPYVVLVSELMLQQTQVSRVIPKFNEFIGRFPTLEVLAASPLSTVLEAWSGLGYNRRAKFLHEAAKAIVRDHDGQLPTSVQQLVTLPGVGKNTAGAIVAYAFNKPVLFLETNIRTVLIYHFFDNTENVDDKQLLPLLEAMLPGPQDEPIRDWYYALMDYGSYLKQTVGNKSRSSRGYTKQSSFIGSKRQVRGQVLRLLIIGTKTRAELSAEISDERLNEILADLLRERLIVGVGSSYKLAD